MIKINRLNSDLTAKLGEKLCLDFVNTASWHESEKPIENLNDIETFIDWCAFMGIIDDSSKNQFYLYLSEDSFNNNQILNEIIEIREVIFRIFRNIAFNEEYKNEDMIKLINYLPKIYKDVDLTKNDYNFTIRIKPDAKNIISLIFPVIQSAIELLTQEDMNRIKICGGERCGWLFYDTSRNNSRKWCSMADCGNREKSKRHYYKNKKG